MSLVWGTSFILIKKSLEVYSPVQVALLRLGLSGLAFLPLFLYQIRKIDWKRWYFFVLVGLCGSGIPAFLFAFAQMHISSSVAGILNSLTPLFTLLIGIIIFRAKLLWAKVVGVLLGLVGAAMLILFSNGNNFQGDVGYSLLIILAAMCYATSTNIVGNKLRDVKSLIVSTFAFASVGIPSFLILITNTDFLHVLTTHPQGLIGLGYVGFLALVGTVLATIIFFKLIQDTNPVFASTVAYIMPIVALLWGLLDGETIGLYHLLGMGLILLGVYLSRK
ncbi:MAG: DMT family transporter [Saprospiraceae bacterium]|nr:DMT family transporter [Saprospiraceae bacterium]